MNFKILETKKGYFIAKKGKKSTSPDGFRPISLLELPYKIVSSRYASFLEKGVEKIIL